MDRRQWRETFFPGSGQGALKIQEESNDARPLTPPTIPAPVLPRSIAPTLPIPPPPPSETARAYARKRPKTKDASPSSADASVRSGRLLPIQRGYPWKKYQKEWAIGLKGTVAIAYNVHNESELVAIREYQLNNDLTPAVVQMLQHIRHKNVVDLRELYNQHSSLYTVTSYMDISVDDLIACPKVPTEEQIATIICEVCKVLLCPDFLADASRCFPGLPTSIHWTLPMRLWSALQFFCPGMERLGLVRTATFTWRCLANDYHS